MDTVSRIEIAPGYAPALRDEGSGPAVVLLHGTPFDLRCWDPLVAALDGRRRTIRWDARGHGSATATPVADPARLALDVVAVLDRLELAEVHVVGHSWGGEIAQQLALDHPTRVGRLSLLCTRASPFPAFGPLASALRDGTAVREASLSRWFGPAELAGPDPLVGATGALLRAADAVNWADALDQIAVFDALDRLHRVAAPVDVVAAELDGVAAPDHMARIADALADASFHVLPGARHLAPLQRAGEVAWLLTA